MPVPAISKRKQCLMAMAFYAVALLLGFMQAWANRFSVYEPDSISYLDLAKAFQENRWSDGVSGNWSPLYPFLIGAVLRCFNPDQYSIFPLLKLTNYAIYLCLLPCWQALVNEVVDSNRTLFWLCEKKWCGKLEFCFRLCAGIIFLWAFLVLGGVYQDTPDLACGVFLLLSTLFLLRICRGMRSARNYLLMGVCLGLGYLAKGIMLPLSVVFFALALLFSERKVSGMRLVIASGVVFICVISPWVSALSCRYGHFTTGNQGSIAYMCGVSYQASLSPAIVEEGREALRHPTRILSRNPLAYEYSSPVGGTYPFWTDPSYWFEGLSARIDPVSSLLAFVCDWIMYIEFFIAYICLFWLVALLIWRRHVFSLRALKQAAALWLPALVGFFLYSLSVNLFLWVWVKRYLSGFASLILLGAFSSVRLADERKGAQAICAALLSVTAALVVQVVAGVRQTVEPPNVIGRSVATALADCGLKPGSRMAELGGFELLDWAFLAGVQVVANLPDPDAFFACDQAALQSLFAKLKVCGVRAIIYFPHPLSSESIYVHQLLDRRMDQLFAFFGRKRVKNEQKKYDSHFYLERGWRRLAQLDCYVYLLN